MVKVRCQETPEHKPNKVLFQTQDLLYLCSLSMLKITLNLLNTTELRRIIRTPTLVFSKKFLKSLSSQKLNWTNIITQLRRLIKLLRIVKFSERQNTPPPPPLAASQRAVFATAHYIQCYNAN